MVEKISRERLFLRGNGKYWIDDNGFNFQRYLTKTTLLVPFKKIIGIKEGKWHSGKWVGNLLILKILWSENNTNLSSGFVITRNSVEFHTIINDLQVRISNLKS